MLKSILAVILAMFTSRLIAFEKTDKLYLPETIYAVPGIEMNVYFQNIFLTINHKNFAFDVDCKKGRNDTKRWRFVPDHNDIGEYDWKVTVYNDEGVVTSGSTKLIVVPENAGEGTNISVLLIGDSLTDMVGYPQHFHELMSRAGNPYFKMIGSHSGIGAPPVADGVAIEGYGGWSWGSFASERKPVISKNRPYRFNKFVFEENGKWKLNFQKYFDKYNNGKAPDIVIINLGPNDCFNGTDETIAELTAKSHKYMKAFIEKFRCAAPKSIIGIGLCGGGASQDGFGKSYGCVNTSWQFERNTDYYRRTTAKIIKEMNDKAISTIPVFINIDRENCFPVRDEPVCINSNAMIKRQSNGVHPAREGFNQMADTVYSWLKYQMSDIDIKEKENE